MKDNICDVARIFNLDCVSANREIMVLGIVSVNRPLTTKQNQSWNGDFLEGTFLTSGLPNCS